MDVCAPRPWLGWRGEMAQRLLQAESTVFFAVGCSVDRSSSLVTGLTSLRLVVQLAPFDSSVARLLRGLRFLPFRRLGLLVSWCSFRASLPFESV